VRLCDDVDEEEEEEGTANIKPEVDLSSLCNKLRDRGFKSNWASTSGIREFDKKVPHFEVICLYVWVAFM
jgi:hypothetical protein